MQIDDEAGALPSPAGEPPIPEAARSSRFADPSFAGCFVVGAFGLLLLVYFGFFAFALCDAWIGWNILDRHIDDRTGAVLRTIYWPLIKVCEKIGIP